MLQNSDLVVRLDRVLSEQTALRGQIQTLVRQGAQIMSTQNDILAALNASKDATAKARVSIQALEAENADLKAQLAVANNKAGDAVDSAAVEAAIADANASTKALTDAIPAGSDHVVGDTGAATAAPIVSSADATIVLEHPNPPADIAAMNAIGTATGDTARHLSQDSSEAAIGAVPLEH